MGMPHGTEVAARLPRILEVACVKERVELSQFRA
jgi:hypothetical protein